MSEDSDTFEEGMAPSPAMRTIKDKSAADAKKEVTESAADGKKKGGKKSSRVGKKGGTRCTTCSAALKPGMRFCSKCGNAQPDGAAPAVAPAASAVPEARKSQEEEVIEEIIEEEIVVVEEEEHPPVPAASGGAKPPPSSAPRTVTEPMTMRPNPTSRTVLVEHVVDEDGDEEEEDSATPSSTPTLTQATPLKLQHGISAKHFENSPKRVTDLSSDEEPGESKSPGGSAKQAPVSGPPSARGSNATEPRGAELAEMAHFFEKHRLTRERLEMAAGTLLEKLKMLQKTPAERKKAEPPIDAADWEEYDVQDPLFPFVALAQEARNLYLPRAIDVLKEPVDPLTFYREYVAQNVPVVIRNAIKNWKTGQWSNAYLRKAMGGKEVSVECTPKGKGDYIRKGKFVMPERRHMKLSDFLDVMEGTTRIKGNLYISQQNSNFIAEFAALHADVEPHLAWATEAFGCRPEVTNIWIGDAKAFSACHKDHYENIYVVVAGEKHFTLLPPTDFPFLYEQRFPPARFKQDAAGKWRVYDEPQAQQHKVPWIAVDPDAPDLTQFPLFAHCRPYKVTVKAGECLYLPSLWYHQVSQSPDSEGRCIAINFWYDMRYDAKFNYRNFLANTWKLWPSKE